jgi:acetyl esterase/lipase
MNMNQPSQLRSGLLKVALFVAAVQISRGAETEPPKIVQESVVYKRLGDLEIKADVHHFKDEKLRPVVVWLHGGALMMGGREGRFPWREMILTNGYVLVSPDYRLAPQAKLPEIIADIEDALRWLRGAGAKQFHIDPERVAGMGASAGGYLTLVAGYRVNPRPRALVSLFGYGDIIGDWYTTPSPHPRHNRKKYTETEARQAVQGPVVSNDRERKQSHVFYDYCRQNGLWPKMVSGWDPKREPEKFFPFMPVKNVTKDYPPTVLIHGTADTDVPFEESKLMADEFKKHGVPFEFYEIAGGEHGLGGGDPAAIKSAYGKAFEFVKARLEAH